MKICIEIYDKLSHSWKLWETADSQEDAEKSIDLFLNSWREYGDGRYRVIYDHDASGGRGYRSRYDLKNSFRKI